MVECQPSKLIIWVRFPVGAFFSKMAITNLKKLIKNMQPEIAGKGFVFCTSNKIIKTDSIMIFKEKEGFTCILKEEEAKKNNLTYEGTWDRIILNVNLDLEAVGFLSKITQVLAEKKISVNVVSAYYHDHLFVPSSKSKKALRILKNLSQI